MGCKISQTPAVEDFALRVKASGEEKTFSCVSEDNLMKTLDCKNKVSQFDMCKLEVEYDYDTESE